MSFRISTLFVLGIVAAPAFAAPPAATVGINGFTYQPNMPQIVAGDSVQFAASGFHPLGFVGDTNNDNNCDAGCVKVFAKAGTYPFFCFNHENMGMTGVITVAENPDFIFLDTFEFLLQPDS